MLEAREKSRVHGAIGFGFTFHWLKKWCESFKPIVKRSNRNHVFTVDSHLKTAQIQLSQGAEKSRVQVAISFGIASHGSESRREIFKPSHLA